MKILWCGMVLGLAATGACLAQEAGGIPIRVNVGDGVEGRCIDGTKDRVWLTLRRLVTTKTQGWFTKDKDVEVIINAQVKTDPQPPKPLVFPLSTNARFGDVPSGQVSVPIEYTIVSGLALTQSNVSYTGLDVSVTLLNIRDRNRLGNALQALDKLTSSAKLPIPSSPYVQGLTYLLDFANTTVQGDIDSNNKDDKFVSGSLTFNFDPDGQCSSGGGGDGFETTGTKAIVYSAGPKGDGYVDIGHPSDYCFTADLTPAFVLKVSKKAAGQACPDPKDSTKYTDVTNNYVGFFLNKRTVAKQLGPSSAAERDNREAIRRCQANGILNTEVCLKAN